MTLIPRIIEILPKKLVGQKITMSLAKNRTFELWHQFMPQKSKIKNLVNQEMISMQIYATPLRLGDVNQAFEKWAAIEVHDFTQVPDNMLTFELVGGKYAVFDYKGLSTDPSIFIYIFGTWLPNSEYEVDDRPHFEILGERYKNTDPDSEEEIWIPIR